MKPSERQILCLRVTPTATLPTQPEGATERAVTGFAESCFRFTPRLARGRSHFLFLDLTETQSLLQLRTLPGRLRWLAHRHALKLEALAAGETAGEAFARSCFDLKAFDWGKLGAFPLETLESILYPFESSLEFSSAWKRRIGPLLKKLGIHTLEGLDTLPAGSLAARFGALGKKIEQRNRDELWPLFIPPEKIIETFTLQDPETQSGISGVDSLLYVIRQLLDSLFSRLKARSLRLSRLQIDFKLDHAPARTLSLSLPLPQGSTSAILPLLRDRLAHEFERKNPLEAPATEIQLTVVETTPGHGAQSDFFRKKEEEAEKLDALLLRLTERLGERTVFQAQLVDTHWPESAWTRAPLSHTSAAMPSFSSAVTTRPVRLLSTPIRLTTTAFEILEGPERILPPWDATSFTRATKKRKARDYYRIRTSDQSELWVFSEAREDPKTGKLWIHGAFD